MNQSADVLELKIQPAEFPTGATRQIVPYINGRSVSELHVESRKSQARRVGKRKGKTNGGHAGLAVQETTDLSDLRPKPGLTHQAPVLGCICGEAWCDPVLAEISVSADAVIWRMPRLTFRFELRQYEEALRTAEAG